jgi:hypothetical protein
MIGSRITELEERISSSLFPNLLDILELQELSVYTEIIISGMLKYVPTRAYCEIDDFFYTPGRVTAEEILLFINSIVKPEGFIFTRTYPQQVAGENRILVEYRYFRPSDESRIVPIWQVEIENAINKCLANPQQPHSGRYYRKKYGRPKKSRKPSKEEVINI